MTIDDAWDSVEAPIWVPQVRVAAQAETAETADMESENGDSDGATVISVA